MKEQRFRTDVLPLKNELFRLALRITLNPAEAEDVVQETMIRVWNRREQWDQIESMEAFCLTICRNLALDHQRLKANQHASLDELSTVNSQLSTLTSQLSTVTSQLSTVDTPEQQAVRHDQLRLVKELMNELPEKQRTCMQLRDIEGHSYREIADIMRITEQQVKVNIFRARQTIKQRFQEDEQYGL